MFYAILVLCSAEDGINTTKAIKGKKRKVTPQKSLKQVIFII